MGYVISSTDRLLYFPLLQDCLSPEKLQCFWSSAPGCLWPARSISHAFSPSFWGISAWSACQHMSLTLHCSSPTWNEGELLTERRKRLDRKGPLWNPTLFFFSFFFFFSWAVAALDLKTKLSPTVFLLCLHLLRLFREAGLDEQWDDFSTQS